jgi:hypothetical protein
MGYRFFDQYSILHFASGVVVYFWGMSLEVWVVLHTLFEIFENTRVGMTFITDHFKLWPGGKSVPDNFLNSAGDTVFAIAGWIVARALDRHFKTM